MVSRRQAVVLTLLLLTAVMWGFSGFFEAEARDGGEPERVGEDRLIRPAENGSALWPYTSSGKSVNQRTLAINIVVHGSDENVRRALTKRGELDFQPVEHEGENATADNETADGTGNGTFLGRDSGAGNGTPVDDATPESGPASDDGAGAGNGTSTPEDPLASNRTPTGTDTPDETLTPNETHTPNETLTPNESEEDAAANETRNESQVVEIRPTGIQWTDAHGAVRYTYIDANPDDGGGQWVEESYQLRSGPYLGSRLHIRAYASPTDDWTALQVHEDYWDWFRLRHSVPDTRESARTVESNFIGRPYVGDVSRTYYGIEGGRSDGWLSEVELSSAAVILSLFPGAAVTGAAVLLGVVSADTRRAAESALRWLLRDAYRQRGGLLLAGTLGAIVLGVRIGGIAVETTFPAVHPKLIVAALYPVLAIGLPAITAVGWFTRETDPSTAFGFVVVGVGAAFVLDFGVIGVSAVPIGLLLHRTGLLVALGLIAAGTAHGGIVGRPLRLLGAGAWVVGLVLPLLSLL